MFVFHSMSVSSLTWTFAVFSDLMGLLYGLGSIGNLLEKPAVDWNETRRDSEHALVG